MSTLRERQTPLREAYQREPARARVLLSAEGVIDLERFTCQITSGKSAPIGLHPAVGGEPGFTCSGDLLLEALVGCAGVTLAAVVRAMKLEVRSARARAEADWDARGTLGVGRDAPVGLQNIRLRFELDTDASDEDLRKLAERTERYCVVAATLKAESPVDTHVARSQPSTNSATSAPHGR